jgi:hypothetical protein
MALCQRWLTSPQIAEALGYNQANRVAGLRQRRRAALGVAELPLPHPTPKP